MRLQMGPESSTALGGGTNGSAVTEDVFWHVILHCFTCGFVSQGCGILGK